MNKLRKDRHSGIALFIGMFIYVCTPYITYAEEVEGKKSNKAVNYKEVAKKIPKEQYNYNSYPGDNNDPSPSGKGNSFAKEMGNNEGNISVNEQTGQVICNAFGALSVSGIVPDMDINIGIIPSGSEDGVMGLSAGYAFNIDYIEMNSQLNRNILHMAGGEEYILTNKNEEDEWASGLEYIESKNIEIKKGEGQTYGIDYQYKLSDNINGIYEYFDDSGLLKIRADRNDNHIIYDYKYLNDNNLLSPQNSKLSKIIDSYGKTINFLYRNNYTHIEISKDGIGTIGYDIDYEVVRVTDLNGGKTKITMNSKHQICKVKYPSGLIRKFEYGANISYKNKFSEIPGYILAVSKETIEIPGGGNQTILYEYGKDNGSESNYTGYPQYEFREDLPDTLMADYYSSYQYSVSRKQVTKDGYLKTSTIYNHLHLPIKVVNYANHGNGNILLSKLEFKYDLDKIHGHYKRYYNQPILVYEISYDPTGSYYAKAKSYEYNKYNQATREDDYSNISEVKSIDSLDLSSYTPEISKTTSYYTDIEGGEHGEIKTETTQDKEGDTISVSNTLSDDKKYIKNSITTRSGKSISKDTTEDSCGRVISGTVSPTNSSEGKSTTHIGYGIDGNNLTITKSIDGYDDIKSIDIIDIRSGKIIEKILPGDNDIKYQYSDDYLTDTMIYGDGSSIESNTILPSKDSIYLREITVSSNGEKSEKDYDALGRKISEYNNVSQNTDGKLILGQQCDTLIESKTYNGLGQVDSVTDSSGKTLNYEYDDFGQIKSVINFLNHKIEIINSIGQKDANGDKWPIQSSIYVNGIYSSSTYNNANNKTVETIDPLDNTSNYSSYNGFGEIIGTKNFDRRGDAKTETKNYVYYLDGVHSFETRTREGADFTTTITRDAQGNEVSRQIKYASVPKGVKIGNGIVNSGTSTFDIINRKISYINQNGQIINYTYYPYGEIKSANDYNGNVYNYTYVKIGEKWEKNTLEISSTNGNKYLYSYNYDLSPTSPSYGEMLSVEVSRNGSKDESSTISYGYDAIGLMCSETMNGKSMIINHILINGRPEISNIIDYAGVKTDYRYYNSPGTAVDGNLESVSNPYGTETYSYFAEASGNGMIKSDDPLLWGGNAIANTCIQENNGTTQNVSNEYFDAKGEGFEQNNAHRLKSTKTEISFPNQTPIYYTSSYEYADGMLKSETRNSNAGSGIDYNNVNTYEYNDFDELISDSVSTIEATNDLEASRVTNYTYDINSNVLSKSVKPSSGSTQTYLYKYDKNSFNDDSYALTINQLMGEQIKNDQGIVTNEYKFVYDKNGNMLQENDKEFNQVFTYDAQNELTRYEKRNSSSANDIVDMSYSYNALNLRSQKYFTVDDNNPSKEAISYYYNGDNISNESNPLFGMSSYLNRSVRTIITSSGSSQSQNLVSDGKNIVASIGDGNVSNSNENYNYTPYGSLTSYANPDAYAMTGDLKSSSDMLSISQNPFRYSSYYYEQESDLYYCNARYYSPLLMRFISLDTITLPNQYAYANGNPIMNVDPTGHMSAEKWRIISYTAAIVTTVIAAILSGGIFEGAAFELANSSIAGVDLIKSSLEDKTREGETQDIISNLALVLNGLTGAFSAAPTAFKLGKEASEAENVLSSLGYKEKSSIKKMFFVDYRDNPLSHFRGDALDNIINRRLDDEMNGEIFKRPLSISIQKYRTCQNISSIVSAAFSGAAAGVSLSNGRLGDMVVDGGLMSIFGVLGGLCYGGISNFVKWKGGWAKTILGGALRTFASSVFNSMGLVAVGEEDNRNNIEDGIVVNTIASILFGVSSGATQKTMSTWNNCATKFLRYIYLDTRTVINQEVLTHPNRF